MSSFASRVLFALAVGGLGGCWLATDFDQFTKGDAGVANSGDGGAGVATNEGGVLTSNEGGTSEAGVIVTCDTTKTSDDPKNCGACAHDCLGGDCLEGKCQPVLLADDMKNPNGVAFTSAGLYIGSDDGLYLLPSGGKKLHKISGPGAPQFLVATATDVFFADYPNGVVSKVAIGTENIVTIRSGIPKIEGLALSPAFIFWTQDSISGAQRMPFSTVAAPTSTIEQLTKSFDDPNGLAWADGVLYAASYAEDRLVAVGHDGKDFDSAREVLKGDHPYGVKVDGPDVFVTCADGFLKRVRVDGSAVETLLSNLNGPNGVDVTATTIYFTESDSGKVQMLAR